MVGQASGDLRFWVSGAIAARRRDRADGALGSIVALARGLIVLGDRPPVLWLEILPFRGLAWLWLGHSAATYIGPAAPAQKHPPASASLRNTRGHGPRPQAYRDHRTKRCPAPRRNKKLILTYVDRLRTRPC